MANLSGECNNADTLRFRAMSLKFGLEDIEFITSFLGVWCK